MIPSFEVYSGVTETVWVASEQELCDVRNTAEVFEHVQRNFLAVHLTYLFSDSAGLWAIEANGKELHASMFAV